MAGLFFDSGIGKGFETDLKRMNTKMNAFSNNVVKRNSLVSDSFSQVKNQITGVVSVLAIGAAGKELLNFTKDLETALIEVSTISQAVTDDFEGYKNQLLALSTEGGQGVVELTQAFYDLVSAGFDAQEGITLLATAQEASTAGFVETKVAADGLTTVLNAWGKTAQDAGKVSDIFFKTVEKGKTTFPELASNIAQVAPVAAALGVSFEEISGAAATLTKAGTPTAQAFTQIRSSLLAVNEVLGDGWAEAFTYQEALDKVREKAGGSTNELKKMLGRIEAVNAVLGLTGKNAITAAEDLDAMNDALGATGRAALKVTETTDQQIKILKNSILAALEPLGAEASSTIATLAKNLNEAFKSGEVKKYADIILQLGKAFLAYKVSVIALNQLDKLRKNILLSNIKAMRIYAITGKQVSAASVGMAKAAKGLKAAFAANPIGLLVAGLTLAIPLIKTFAESLKKVNEGAIVLAEVANETAGNLDKETASLKVLQTQLQRTKGGSEDRVRLVKELNKQYPDLLGNIDGETASISVLNGVFNDYIKNLEKTIRLKVLQSKFESLVNEQIDIRNNKDLSSNEAFAALQVTEKRIKALEEELVFQKNIVDVNQKYAELIREQTQLLSQINEGGELKKQLIGQLQTYEDFVESYKILNNTLPDGTIISRDFSKEELDKAYLEEVARQNSLIASTEKTANRLRQIEQEIKNEIEGVIGIAARKNKEALAKEIDPLKALALKNQLIINEIIKQYGTEEELQKQFNRKLLENELVFLQEKRKLTTDALNKAKIDEQIIIVKSTLSASLEQQEIEELLKQFQTYTTRRVAIEKQYQDDISLLKKAGREEEAAEAQKALNSELQRLDESILSSNARFQKWLKEGLPKIAQQGIQSIKDAIENTDIILSIGDLNPEQIVAYKKQIELLQKKLEELETPVIDVNKSFKDSLEIINGVNKLANTLIGTFEGLDEGSKAMLTGVVNVSSGLVNMANGVKAVGDAVGALEKASAILAVISTSIQILNAVNSTINAIAEQREQALINELQQVQAINLELIKQNALYKEGNELFSDDQWGTALAGLESYNLALNAQKDLLAEITQSDPRAASKDPGGILKYVGAAFVGLSALRKKDEKEQIASITAQAETYSTTLERSLANIAVKTKDRSGFANFFGASDEYNSLLQVYPKLVKANGELDTVILQTIIDTEDLAEADKTRLTNLIELTVAAEESYSQFGDFISSTFGGVGDDITQAFQLMFETGDDAMSALEGSFSDMIESFTRDAIEFAFLQPYLNELNDATKELGVSFAKGDITADQLQADIISTLGDFYGSLNTLQPEILKAFENADRLAAEAGFESAFNAPEEDIPDIIEVEPPEDELAKSIAGQISDSITEETGGQMVGRLGAIMLSNERIANNTEDISDYALANLVALNKIVVNTDYLPEIAENTRQTVEKLQSI